MRTTLFPFGLICRNQFCQIYPNLLLISPFEFSPMCKIIEHGTAHAHNAHRPNRVFAIQIAYHARRPQYQYMLTLYVYRQKFGDMATDTTTNHMFL